MVDILPWNLCEEMVYSEMMNDVKVTPCQPNETTEFDAETLRLCQMHQLSRLEDRAQSSL